MSSVTVDLQSSSSGSSTSASGEKAGAKASGTLTVGFHYENDSGGDCNLSTTETVQDSDLPYNESFDPANFSGSLSSGCGSPADFDGVQVEFAPGSGFPTSGLVLSLLDENGTEITSDDNLSDGLGVSGTVSDDVDLPGDDGGGGDDGDGDETDTDVKPAWIGNWKTGDFVLVIEKSSLTRSEKVGGFCRRLRQDIVNVDGDEISTEGDNEDFKYRIKSVSESSIKVSSNAFSVEGFDTRTYQSADDSQTDFELLDCPESQL
jgi:hypothetical protein